MSVMVSDERIHSSTTENIQCSIQLSNLVCLGGGVPVFCQGLKKGTVLLGEKGHFCSRNYILRPLSHAELFSEGTLHKLWATYPMFEM